MYKCDICFEEKKKKKVLGCSHFLCKMCYDKLIKNTCPFCRQPFKREEKTLKTNPEYYRDIDDDWVSFSGYLKNDTEIIKTFRSSSVPISWRNNEMTTIIKKRKRRYN